MWKYLASVTNKSNIVSHFYLMIMIIIIMIPPKTQNINHRWFANAEYKMVLQFAYFNHNLTAEMENGTQITNKKINGMRKIIYKEMCFKCNIFVCGRL